jgi:hypothetical protein
MENNDFSFTPPPTLTALREREMPEFVPPPPVNFGTPPSHPVDFGAPPPPVNFGTPFQQSPVLTPPTSPAFGVIPPPGPSFAEPATGSHFTELAATPVQAIPMPSSETAGMMAAAPPAPTLVQDAPFVQTRSITPNQYANQQQQQFGQQQQQRVQHYAPPFSPHSVNTAAPKKSSGGIVAGVAVGAVFLIVFLGIIIAIFARSQSDNRDNRVLSDAEKAITGEWECRNEHHTHNWFCGFTFTDDGRFVVADGDSGSFRVVGNRIVLGWDDYDDMRVTYRISGDTLTLNIPRDTGIGTWDVTLHQKQ